MLPRRPRFVLVVAALSTGLLHPARAGFLPAPVPAPEFAVSEWINTDEPLSVKSLRGKVVLIHFFQLWCPGCNRFSKPLFRDWQERFGEREDVAILGIHTVFEGHYSQTPGRLHRYLRTNGITYPVGVDAYANPEDDVPITMRRYRTGGTPTATILDRQGNIRFQQLGSFRPEPVEALIEALLEESPAKD